MLDIGGLELLVVAVVALIVVGPKELPGLVRNVGRWVAKARNLAREFQSGMEAAAREADVEELRQVGSIKSDLERQVRDMGRKAQTMMDDVDMDAPAKPAARPRREPEAPRSDAAERSTGYEDDYPRGERRGGDDAVLERFQTGMRGRD